MGCTLLNIVITVITILLLICGFDLISEVLGKTVSQNHTPGREYTLSLFERRIKDEKHALNFLGLDLSRYSNH